MITISEQTHTRTTWVNLINIVSYGLKVIVVNICPLHLICNNFSTHNLIMRKGWCFTCIASFIDEHIPADKYKLLMAAEDDKHLLCVSLSSTLESL